jgi:hypothetical protein
MEFKAKNGPFVTTFSPAELHFPRAVYYSNCRVQSLNLHHMLACFIYTVAFFSICLSASYALWFITNKATSLSGCQMFFC